MDVKTGCEACNKTSLFLLLLRPSPIAKKGPVAPLAVSGIAADPAVIAGLLPTRLPTESRFVLRLLRSGYVHIYIPNPPAGVSEWLVYRVTAEADLVPQGHCKFSQPGQNVACISDAHVPTGMKVVSIPRAHKIADIWIAYGANLWNDTLRAQNKANPIVMQKVSLKKGGANTFTPTAENLKAQVLEFGISKVVIDKSVEQDFAFTKLVNHVDDIVAGLRRAAARHPQTAGKELAVVLRDPAGICAELNALRLRRNESIKREFEKPEVMHPLNSSRLLMDLKESVIDEADMASLDGVIPLLSSIGLARTKLPPGAEVVEITPAERRDLLAGKGRELTPYQQDQLKNEKRMYLVIYPDVEKRAQKWKENAARKNWEKFANYYDEKARTNWVTEFEARMKRDHYDALEKMEDDWYSTVHDPMTNAYIEHHFDPTPAGGKPATDSQIRTEEETLMFLPGPFTCGKMTERYVAMLDQPITAPEARALRTFVGGKANTIPLLGQQLTGDPAKEDGGGMRDKTYDLMKGFTELMGPGSLTGKWIGHSLALFSIGLTSALTGAVLTLAARGSTLVKPEYLRKLHQLVLAQRALEHAVQGAVKGKAPSLPVLVKMTVSAQEALQIRSARPGEVKGRDVHRLRRDQIRGRSVELALLTDTDSIKAANGDVDAVARRASTGTVSLGANATAIAQGAAQGKYAVLSKDAFVRLFQQQMSTTAHAANLTRRAMAEFAQPSSSLTAMAKTVDSRLALAGMLVHALGIWHGYNAVEGAKSESSRIDADYALQGNMVGFAGAALQLGALGMETRLKMQHVALGGTVAEDVIHKHVGLGALRVLGAFTGVAGGYLDFVGSKKKSKDQDADGNSHVAQLYDFSAYASVVTAFTAFSLTAGQIAHVLAARGVGGAVMQTVATRLAGNIAFRALGIGLSATGVGLVFLGASVAFQIGAIVMTPDDLQRWIARTYFGTDGGIIFVGRRSDRFPDWLAEIKALKEVIVKAEKTENERKKNLVSTERKFIER